VIDKFKHKTLRNRRLYQREYGQGYVENNVFEGGNAIDADGVDFDGVTDGKKSRRTGCPDLFIRPMAKRR